GAGGAAAVPDRGGFAVPDPLLLAGRGRPLGAAPGAVAEDPAGPRGAPGGPGRLPDRRRLQPLRQPHGPGGAHLRGRPGRLRPAAPRRGLPGGDLRLLQATPGAAGGARPRPVVLPAAAAAPGATAGRDRGGT